MSISNWEMPVNSLCRNGTKSPEATEWPVNPLHRKIRLFAQPEAGFGGFCHNFFPGRIVIDIKNNLPKILVDRDKFAQVIGNLLSNAVKYSPKGGRITLSAYSNPETNSVVVSVADEGIGIDHNDKESLFKTFHRIQRPETMGIRGSGLGLFIVKEWTERMGGEVWLESELNKGSTFFVSVQADNSNPTT